MLMERMRWSWDDLQATPVYVRRYCVDFLGIRSRVQEQKGELERLRQRG